MWNLVTEGGRLDIAWTPAGTQGYSDLVRDAISYDLDGTVVRAASLGDVIRSMEAAGRERDRTALPTLRLLLERLEREEDKPSNGRLDETGGPAANFDTPDRHQ